MAKRLLCVVLSLLMIIAVLPTGVVADETYTEWSTTDSLPTSGTYKLVTNVNVSSQYKLTGNLTLDLNGYTITYTASSGESLFYNKSYVFTVEDSSELGSGSIVVAETSYSGVYLLETYGGTVNINGGTLSLKSSSGSYYCIQVSGSAILNVNGGVVESACGNGAAIYMVQSATGSINISGSAQVTNSGSSGSAIYFNSSSGTLTISGDATVSNSGANGSAIYMGKSGTVNIEGNATVSNTGTTTACALYINRSSTVTLNISGNVTVYSARTAGCIYLGGSSSTSASISISGGTFNSTSFQSYLTTNASYVDNGDGTYTVSTPATPAFYGKNIVLAGEIGVKFYVDFTDVENPEDYSVKFTVDGKDAGKVAFNATENFGAYTTEGIYYFQCDVACWEMGAKITAQIMNGTEEVGEAIEYSVSEYVSNRKSNSSNANFVSLLNAMLNFGYYTEQYYGSTVGTLSGTTLSSSVVTTDMSGEFDLSGYAATLSESNSLDVRAGLVLDTIVELRFYVPTSESTTYTVKIDGTVVQSSGTYTSGDVTYNYYTTDANTLVQNWDYGHSIEVTDSEGTVVYSATGYSVMSYANTVLTESAYSSYTDLQNLVKAMYLYNQAANTYLGLN